jgi:flagellar biogenesis protein FliO
MDGGVLSAIVRTLLALVGVCALAWFALRWLAQRGIGGAFGGARLRLIERLTLAPRRELYLVQVDARLFLMGAADGGALALIAELEPPVTESGTRIADLIGQLQPQPAADGGQHGPDLVGPSRVQPAAGSGVRLADGVGTPRGQPVAHDGQRRDARSPSADR